MSAWDPYQEGRWRQGFKTFWRKKGRIDYYSLAVKKSNYITAQSQWIKKIFSARQLEMVSWVPQRKREENNENNTNKLEKQHKDEGIQLDLLKKERPGDWDKLEQLITDISATDWSQENYKINVFQ